MNNRKWYNFETMWDNVALSLREFLLDNNIKFETSGCFGGVHFEVLCNPAEVQKVNNFLDSLDF